MALLLGGWLVLLGINASSHLVHHLFEADHGAACHFLAAATHVPAAVAAPVVLPKALPAPEGPAAPLRPARRSPSGRAAATRAPPSALLSSG